MARPNSRSSADRTETPPSGEQAPNPIWFKPIMFGFMLLGLAWIVLYYLSNTQFPIESIGNWNIMVGFGIMFIGFLMTTRWR